jgi:hypothetical protein
LITAGIEETNSAAPVGFSRRAQNPPTSVGGGLGIAVAVKLIPKDILEESRHFAQKRIDSKKPINWIAGAIIIAIWAALLAFIIYRVVLHSKE